MWLLRRAACSSLSFLPCRRESVLPVFTHLYLELRDWKHCLTTAQHLGTKSVWMFPKDLPLHLPASHVGEHCPGPRQVQSLHRSGLVPWQSEHREHLCISHRQSQALETDTRTCSFLPHECPVSVSGNRVVLCLCNGSVSLYFLPLPSPDWLSPNCGEQKPEVWPSFARGKKGEDLFLLKQKGLSLKRENIVHQLFN